MLKLLYKISGAALLLICISTGLIAQPNELKNPYTVEVQALKGESATDVYLTFSTADPVKHPIPASIKTLQLKMRNAAGDIVFIQNGKDLALSGSRYTAAVTDVNQHNELEILAKIESPSLKKDVIIKTSALCRLKPDLAVTSVFAPAEVKINELFNVEAVINEVKLETGARCNVSLYIDDVLFAAIPNVDVPANGQVSVVFQGVSHAAAEQKNFTIRIDNADPGEYSTGNNTSAFSVNFIDPVLTQGMDYSFMYSVQKNYHYINSYIAENGSYSNIKTQDNPHYELFSFAGYSYPEVYPSGKILGCSVIVETEKGIFRQIEVTDPAVNYQDDCRRNYVMPVPNSLMCIYVTENFSAGSVDYDVYQYGSNKVYIHTINGEIMSQQVEQAPEESFIDASEFISASITLAYENTIFYSEGRLSVNPFQDNVYSFSETYFDYSIGANIVHTVERYYQSSYSNASGSYVPATGGFARLHAGRSIELKGTIEKLPAEFKLEQNYPNPFNPTTTIRFALPRPSDVILRVYDAAGREAATLINKRMEAGYHTVDFNAEGLSSGLYLYLLEANEFISTGKMLLMK